MKAYRHLFKSYLEDGEEILYAVHQHIFTIFKPLGKIILLYILAPIFLYSLVPKLGLIWVIWVAVGIGKSASTLVGWYFNALLVTNLNFIDVTWSGIFDRTAQRIEFNQVETFSYTITGFFDTMINVGDIAIDKFSGNRVMIESVFRPKKRTLILIKLLEELSNTKLMRDHENLKDLLTNVLQKHIKDHGIVVTDD